MSAKQLPPNERTFHIDVTGDTTGRPYTGEFVTICVPTFRQRSMQGVLEARLNQGLQVDADVAVIHHVYSQLKTRLLKSPDWFIEADYGMNLIDENVLVEIWNRCKEAAEAYRKELKGDEAA